MGKYSDKAPSKIKKGIREVKQNLTKAKVKLEKPKYNMKYKITEQLGEVIKQIEDELEDEHEGTDDFEVSEPKDDDDNNKLLAFIGLSKKSKDEDIANLVRLCNSLRKNTREEFTFVHYRSAGSLVLTCPQ